jgi:hypothetical protein
MFKNIFMVMRFAKEWVKWKLVYGGKYRKPYEIRQIYSICNSCPLFDKYAPNADYGNCSICGCHISKEVGLNKAAWSSTRCPDKPAKWIEKKEDSLF